MHNLLIFPFDNPEDPTKAFLSNSFFVPTSDTPNQSTSDHWNELHRYSYTTEEACRVFYSDWYRRIPNLNCDCMTHWVELTKTHPPEYASAKKFFEWGVSRHNDVNARLHAIDGRHPPVSLAQAYALHQPTKNALVP